MEPDSGFHVNGVISAPSAYFEFTGVVSFDDGSGPALFVSGVDFAAAGAEPTVGLARWDGSQWRGTGVTQDIIDIAVYDDGTGAKLYALAADAPLLLIWNGSTLVPLADQPNGRVNGLEVVDLGGGPELYVWGTFTHVGSHHTFRVARFDGSTWSPMTDPAGMSGPFAVYDDGSGVKLYGFRYEHDDCPSRAFLARLDGGAWTDLGLVDLENPCHGVRDIQVHDDGTGRAIYVAGSIRNAGGVDVFNIARWDGAGWSAVGEGLYSYLDSPGAIALASFDDGSGPALYACGEFRLEPYGLRRWNGTVWEVVGGGLVPPTSAPFWSGGAQALGVFDDGAGSRLVVAGEFERAGSGVAWNVAAWNGAAWSDFGTGGLGIGYVSDFAYGDVGDGPSLYVGGLFKAAGELPVSNVARWDGSAWSALGTSLAEGVSHLEIFDDGNGAQLYAYRFEPVIGGSFKRWDGAQWTDLPAPAEQVHDMLVHGSTLYAGRYGGVAAFDGTSWSSVGASFNGPVIAIAIHDGDLFATGWFTLVGSVTANGIARFDLQTQTWSSAGTSVTNGQFLTAHQDGAGPELYVIDLGSSMKRLRGGVWTTLPSPATYVNCLESLDLGLGRPTLIASGVIFANEPGTPLKKWTGTSWTAMSSDLVDDQVHALAVVPGTSSCSPELFAGGKFTKWGSTITHKIAKLTLCGQPGNAYCFGDGSLATPCPCVPPNTVPNPSGASGHGCANSFNLDGAKLCAVGTTSPDTVTLRVSGGTPIGFTQFFKGNAQDSAGVAFADGVRCVDGTIFRFGGQNAVLGTAYYPNPSLGLVAPISNGGTPPGSGLTGHYQAIYRNATPNFCTIDTLNITNAVQITWH